ncbi:hypothetical protein EZS27_007204 [termite gut metagenome]|jgi:hypothetical protein|uniref:Uncharacterized protein n=1 Tax=termite gut metagenome TaxID=433724 RepID=A0A5J4SH42_9ZZZZ
MRILKENTYKAIPLRIQTIETMRPDAAIKDPDAVNIMSEMNFEPSSKDKISKGSLAV